MVRQQFKGKLMKKEWHPIVSSKAFDSVVLGETYISDAATMVNSQLTVNLANLTGDIRQQGINLKFRISEVDKGSGVANVIGYEASSAQLRRLVRRGVERLDDSIECKTSDGQLVKVKPFAVTRAAASKAKLSLIRKKLREAITEEVAKLTFDNLVKSIISHNLQTYLKNSVKKLLPLRAIEIRKLELTAIKKPEEKKSAEEKPEEKPQKAEEKKSAVGEPKEKDDKSSANKQSNAGEKTPVKEAEK